MCRPPSTIYPPPASPPLHCSATQARGLAPKLQRAVTTTAGRCHGRTLVWFNWQRWLRGGTHLRRCACCDRPRVPGRCSCHRAACASLLIGGAGRYDIQYRMELANQGMFFDDEEVERRLWWHAACKFAGKSVFALVFCGGEGGRLARDIFAGREA